MPDIIDQAADYEERDRQRALAAVGPAPIIEATGVCLCCDESLPDARRWCDADCRDTYLARFRRR